MKATGIVRRIDSLGRVVLPRELRRSMGIDEKDALEIFVDGNYIILKKYELSCVFCGSTSDINPFKEKMVCKDCSTAVYSKSKSV